MLRPMTTEDPPAEGIAPLTADQLRWRCDPAQLPFASTAEVEPAEAVKPAFTINNQATLVANTTMTALLGKVPQQNNVVDPFRFKVITRDDNLAASGLYLPPGFADTTAYIILLLVLIARPEGIFSTMQQKKV